MKDKIRELLKQIFKINLEINTLLSLYKPSAKKNDTFLQFNSRIEEMLELKNVFIENLKNLKNLNEKEFSELKKTEFKELWEKNQQMENENLEQFNNCREILLQEITAIKTHSKTISSYKFNREIAPRLFDDSL